MKKNSNTKRIFTPITAGVGAALMASVLSISPIHANENPFTTGSDFILAAHDKQGEGKCGEGKCGEGKCGSKKNKEGSEDKHSEGKCGEGKCGSHH